MELTGVRLDDGRRYVVRRKAPGAGIRRVIRRCADGQGVHVAVIHIEGAGRVPGYQRWANAQKRKNSTDEIGWFHSLFLLSMHCKYGVAPPTKYIAGRGQFQAFLGTESPPFRQNALRDFKTRIPTGILRIKWSGGLSGPL